MRATTCPEICIDRLGSMTTEPLNRFIRLYKTCGMQVFLYATHGRSTMRSF